MMKMQVRLDTPNQAMQFVNSMSKCVYDADLKSGMHMVDAKSILGVMAMALGRDVELLIHAEENQCSELRKEVVCYCA